VRLAELIPPSDLTITKIEETSFSAEWPRVDFRHSNAYDFDDVAEDGGDINVMYMITVRDWDERVLASRAISAEDDAVSDEVMMNVIISSKTIRIQIGSLVPGTAYTVDVQVKALLENFGGTNFV